MTTEAHAGTREASARVEAKALRGLYVLTDSRLLAGRDWSAAIRACLAGGARILQYRDKSQDPARRWREASQLRQLCADKGALCIINDDVALARAVEADGVHLGQSDSGLAQAREQLGPTAILGASCHGSLALAAQAVAAGADYLAFGRFHPSHTKPEAPLADPSVLRQARDWRKPLVAIGGIRADNGSPLIEAGADCLAVVEAVWGCPDIEDASRRLAALFQSASAQQGGRHAVSG